MRTIYNHCGCKDELKLKVKFSFTAFQKWRGKKGKWAE